MPKKSKSPAKKKAKAAVKQPVKAKSKKAAKRPVSKTVKKPAKKGSVKTAPVKKAKSGGKAKVNKVVTRKIKSKVKRKVVEPVLAHGIDQHLIPAHKKELITTIKDSRKEEKAFHHNEEVALHQENQKVRAAMARQMGRKRIFRISGRG